MGSLVLGPEEVYVCPTCEYWNAAVEALCVKCGQSLVGVLAVSEERARKMDIRRRLARRRNRLLAWGLITTFIAILAAWATLTYVGANRKLAPPTSSITATPSINDWPMYQRDPAHADNLAHSSSARADSVPGRSPVAPDHQHVGGGRAPSSGNAPVAGTA